MDDANSCTSSRARRSSSATRETSEGSCNVASAVRLEFQPTVSDARAMTTTTPSRDDATASTPSTASPSSPSSSASASAPTLRAGATPFDFSAVRRATPSSARGGRGRRGDARDARGRSSASRGGRGGRADASTARGRAARDSSSRSTAGARDDVATTPRAAGRANVRADFLLNFIHPPRERERAVDRRARTRPPTRRTTRSRAYEKELFLQANFRFLVADSADLRRSAHDADHMVSWDDVVRVEAGSVDPIGCPVCLDDAPTAPQMTVCGHSFCFPCIARHVLTTRDQGKPAKCPMCFTEIRLGDLRSVRRRVISPPARGEKQKFVLVRRRRFSNVPGRCKGASMPPPAAGAWPRALPDCGCDPFAKYTLTGDEVSIATEELESLEAHVAALAEESAASELPYALASIDALTRRLDRWIERRCARQGVEAPKARALPVGVTAPTPTPTPTETKPPESFPALPRRARESSAAYLKGTRVRVESAFTDDEDDEESDPEPESEEETPEPNEDDREEDEGATVESPSSTASAPPSTNAAETQPPTTTPPTTKPTSNERTNIYYFYQAPDGQQVLLHGACLRALLEHHGSYENLPLEIEGDVVELERHTQDEDVRKRAAHLRHLPLTTEFVMVEMDMRALVPRAVLDGPAGEELRQRAKRRSRRNAALARAEAKERREEAKAKVKSEPFSKAARDAMPELGAGADTSMDAALARALAEQTEDEAERMAMYEETRDARGIDGRSFSNIVGRGFASGGPSLNFTTESFGPARGASPPTTAAAPTWGARTAAAEAETPRDDASKKGKKGKHVLFRIG